MILTMNEKHKCPECDSQNTICIIDAYTTDKTPYMHDSEEHIELYQCLDCKRVF